MGAIGVIEVQEPGRHGVDAKTVRGGRNLGAPLRQAGLHYATVHHRTGAVDKADKRIIEDYRRNGMNVTDQMQ